MTAYSFLSSLRNHWYCLRHGQSEANVQHRIASDPARAVENFGLTATGRQQVTDRFSSPHALNSETRIFCSDFRRAHETAQLAAECLDSCNTVTIDTRLRERYFGDYEANSADLYDTVWQADKQDPQQTLNNVESVASVADRMCDLIKSVDTEFNNQTLLIVSHGDPLQILECCFRGADIATHRELQPLQTAELRFLSGFPENHSQPMG